MLPRYSFQWFDKES